MRPSRRARPDARPGAPSHPRRPTPRRTRPAWQAAWSDPTAGLASGEVDAALLRLPFPGQDDMRIEVLLTEPRWVALPATHPLAACDQIAFDQLWDEPFLAAPEETGWWRDY